MADLSDTSPEAERVLTDVYRRMTPAQKWRILGQLYQDARALHAAGLRHRNPNVTPREITEDWIWRHLDVNLPVPVRPPARSQPMPNLKDFADVAAVLDRLGLGYALGGSMACSVYGFSRQTNDADVSVQPFAGREKELIEALGPDYYVSEAAIRQAIAKRSSFNAINTATGFKVDVFIPPDEPFERSAWGRRIALDVEDVSGQRITVLSAEDVILYKLRWYRLGNETSEQQWKDLLGLVKVQRPRLDESYLRHWANEIRVNDLLDRLWAAVPAE
jgi:hypothetical protein